MSVPVTLTDWEVRVARATGKAREPTTISAGVRTIMNGVICILKGGPMRKISVNGKVIEFEMHPYCGPTILKKNGDPAKRQPITFLHAASLWAQQGQVIDNDGLCVWHHEAKPKLRHLGGRHYKVIGYHPPERGQ